MEQTNHYIFYKDFTWKNEGTDNHQETVDKAERIGKPCEADGAPEGFGDYHNLPYFLRIAENQSLGYLCRKEGLNDGKNLRYSPLSIGDPPPPLMELVSIVHFRNYTKRAKNSVFGPKNTRLVIKT